MGRFRLDTSYRRGTLRFLLWGTFDGSSAWEIRHALGGTDAARIVLDFAGVDQAYEFGSAVLSAGLKGLDRTRIEFAHVPAEIRQALAWFGVHVVDEASVPELAFPHLAAAAVESA